MDSSCTVVTNYVYWIIIIRVGCCRCKILSSCRLENVQQTNKARQDMFWTDVVLAKSLE